MREVKRYLGPSACNDRLTAQMMPWYFLGRLPEAEKQNYSDHIRHCLACGILHARLSSDLSESAGGLSEARVFTELDRRGLLTTLVSKPRPFTFAEARVYLRYIKKERSNSNRWPPR